MFHKWCENAYCDGIIDLFESRKSKSKFGFWSVVMIVMLIGSVYFTYCTIMGFIETPTSTHIGAITKASLKLPNVLICNNGGLNATAMKAENFSDDLIINFSLLLNDLFTKRNNLTLAKIELDFYRNRSNINIKEMLEKFGYSCKAIVHEFTNEFANGIQTQNPCTTSIPVIGSNGICYWYQNVGRQHYPGRMGGIYMELKEPKDSFYEQFPWQATEAKISSGFSISLEYDKGGRMSHRSLLIPINASVVITLTPKRYVRLVKQRQCNDSKSLLNSNSCYFQCFVRQAQNDCGCVPVGYWDENLVDNKSKICNPLTYVENCDSVLKVETYRLCQRDCLPKCDEWIYETIISHNILDGKYLNHSKSFVWVAYNTMQYTEFKEVEAFTFDMAVANVGGVSGLWLGASIVTLIQAMYYLFLSMWQRLKNVVGREASANVKF